MLWKLALAALSAGVMVCAMTLPGLAHVIVVPAEAPPAVVQRYSLLVPSEKSIPTTRVEVQFPDGLQVAEVEAIPGWRATTHKDREGRILSAIWDGGSIPPGQFTEFGVVARNPEAQAELTWKAIQTYQDGSEVQWIGPPGARFAGAVTRVRAPGGAPAPAERLSWAAVILALAALVVAGLGWRRAAKGPGRSTG
jgi:uncharacterized protein YcnI